MKYIARNAARHAALAIVELLIFVRDNFFDLVIFLGAAIFAGFSYLALWALFG